MSILHVIVVKLRAWARRGNADRDLDDELRTFVEERAELYERRGLARAEARRVALLDVEGVEHVKETVRDGRVGASLAAAARDVRYGARVLRRSPGHTLVVVLTFALGIGVNVAIFSVVHAVIWRSLPYPDAERIVAIEADTRALPSAYQSSAAPLDLRSQSRLITNVAAVEGRDASLVVNGEMDRVAAARATDDLLPLLGATPLAFGRALSSAEDLDGVVVKGVVISYELWQRRFNGDPQVVGRHVTVNNFDAQVVGVMRPAFRVYLPEADHVEERVDVWLPMSFSPGRLYRGSTLFGRLAPGATVAQAQAECSGLVAAANPPLRLSVRALDDVVTREAKPALAALGAAVGFVLLIACVNVANLMLARAKARERELAVRRALGATRLRLIRQLLAENVVVAILGGAGGLLLAKACIGVMDWLRPVHLPRQSEISIDAVVVLWTVGVTAVSSLVFGLLPAVVFTRDSAAGLRLAGRAGSLMQRRRRLHRGLVLAEVALSIVPLVAAGLMLRTFTNLLQAPIGFDSTHVITARIPLNLQAFSTVDRRSAFYRDAIAHVRALPGVEAVSVGGPLPFAPAQVTQRYSRSEDREAAPSMGLQQSVMPGYFDVMSIPLRAGRDISDDDILQRRRVAVVDERVASQLWPGDAVGQLLTVGQMAPLEVIGVAGRIRARAVRDSDTPMIYVPAHVYEIEQTLVVKTRVPPSSIGPEIKRALDALGPGRAISDIRSMESILEASIDDTRFTMLVLSGFAVVSLILAGVGLYSTLAYLISQRTQEFGVRIAMGASAAGILRLVIREGCVLAGVGAALGLTGAIVISRALRGLLYGVTPLDGVTMIGVAGLIAVVAIAAIARPAWRAARVDPVTALRAD